MTFWKTLFSIVYVHTCLHIWLTVTDLNFTFICYLKDLNVCFEQFIQVCKTMRTDNHTCMCSLMCVSIHTHTCVCIYTYTYTHMCVYLCMLFFIVSPPYRRMTNSAHARYWNIYSTLPQRSHNSVCLNNLSITSLSM